MWKNSGQVLERWNLYTCTKQNRKITGWNTGAELHITERGGGKAKKPKREITKTAINLDLI